MQAVDLEFEARDGLRLVATAWGDEGAPAVVLLHGGGQTRQSWSGAARRLAASGRYAVALDMRGHGESAWCPDGRYRVADFAADLALVLTQLPRPPVVVGASLGGITSLLYAEGHEDLESLRRVVREHPDGRYRWHWDPKFMSETGPAEVADNARLMRAAGTLKVPTLLVRGRESDVISLEGVREFREAAPHAEFVDVSGAGHMVAGERNDAFTEAVQDFLDRHDPI
jgi:pimeloyl-ACP methyl ester carboxylesterase